MIKKIVIITATIFCFSLIYWMNYRVPFVSSHSSKGWSVGYCFSDSNQNINDISKITIFSKEKLKKIDSTTSFLADPFFIKHKDTFYIFFEHQKINKNGADVSVLISDDGINYTFGGTVLSEKFHLSYPQVFIHKDKFYMIPESQAANNVLLYEAVKFPYSWKIKDTLLKNTKLKDPTIYLSDTLNVLIGSNSNMTLLMYESKSLEGEWTPHKNHKMMMGTEARPGGRILPTSNGLIIPIQNSTKGYGYGLSLYKLNFKNNNYTIKKENHLFLKAQENIKEFRGGMHHVDLQLLDTNKYYMVCDGNDLAEDKIRINIYGSVKRNLYDFINYLLF